MQSPRTLAFVKAHRDQIEQCVRKTRPGDSFRVIPWEHYKTNLVYEMPPDITDVIDEFKFTVVPELVPNEIMPNTVILVMLKWEQVVTCPGEHLVNVVPFSAVDERLINDWTRRYHEYIGE